MKQCTWWISSAVISLILIIVLVLLWMQMNQYKVKDVGIRDDGAYNSQQLTDDGIVDAYLKHSWDNNKHDINAEKDPLIKIKTGIFIQSLKFFNSSEVNVSGYIWQRYKDTIHDSVNPCLSHDKSDEKSECEGVGFILPEQVDSGSDIEPRIIYRVRDDIEKEEVIGWYFEATLRQPFDYTKYPFDHKNVWVRLWANDFSKNVVLVPDFESYNYETDLDDIFGIEENIVLGTWVRENTYFSYKPSNYDTNFGIKNYVGKNGFPELYYNFVVKRKFANAFIVYLLPLFLVASLLFAALLTVSDNEELSSRLGFSTSGFIGAASALFFVVMLAHIQLREQFAGTSIVYIEYFYILMYAMLVIATANTYLFSIRSKRWTRVILYNDNIIPKVAYWPVVLSCLIAITVYVMI